MSDDDILKALEEMEQRFGPLPDPDHYPRMFQYYVNMWRHHKGMFRQ